MTGKGKIVSSTRRSAIRFIAATALALVALITVAFAATFGPVPYTGQGFIDGGNGELILTDERCGLVGETPANDGGTGQFANWNGPGQPYQTGQPYLVWVLTANGATKATLYLPDGPVSMINVGGTFKYASGWYDPATLINIVYANYEAPRQIRNPQLTVSHGCAPHQQTAWCSPGYWLNTLGKSPTNGWTTIGVDPYTTMFNSNVYDSFYGALLSPDASLYTVLSTIGGTYKGAGIAGTDPRTQPPNAALNAFNAVAAWATDHIPGYLFDPNLVGSDTACPIDAFGAFKQ